MATQCQSLRDTAEVVAKMGFKMFLGIQAEVGGFSQDQKSFSIYLQENLLSTFVELPGDEQSGDDDLRRLKYSNVYCSK